MHDAHEWIMPFFQISQINVTEFESIRIQRCQFIAVDGREESECLEVLIMFDRHENFIRQIIFPVEAVIEYDIALKAPADVVGSFGHCNDALLVEVKGGHDKCTPDLFIRQLFVDFPDQESLHKISGDII